MIILEKIKNTWEYLKSNKENIKGIIGCISGVYVIIIWICFFGSALLGLGLSHTLIGLMLSSIVVMTINFKLLDDGYDRSLLNEPKKKARKKRVVKRKNEDYNTYLRRLVAERTDEEVLKWIREDLRKNKKW